MRPAYPMLTLSLALLPWAGRTFAPRVLNPKQPQAGTVTPGSSQAEIPRSELGRHCCPQISPNRPRPCPVPSRSRLCLELPTATATLEFSGLSSLSALLAVGIPETKHLCPPCFPSVIGGHTQYQRDSPKPSEQGRIPATIQLRKEIPFCRIREELRD